MKQTSILSYWTLRYLIILIIGLLLVSTASIYWINQSTKMNAVQMSKWFGQEIADRIIDSNGNLQIPPDINRVIDYRKKSFKSAADFCILITNNRGEVIYTRPELTKYEIQKKLTDDMLSARQPDFFAVITQVTKGTDFLGRVILVQPRQALTNFSRENRLLISILLIGLSTLGWLTIYLLARKLSRPIREVAAAARLVATGQYDVKLQHQAKEREISELIISFREMASRLKQLEEWRTVMLAGVTHELKTPVTSIKGLIHAVREEVVTGEESEEFLDIALKEANRMQFMIADLLDFNAFITGFVDVRKEVIDANQLVSEIVYQWNIVQEEGQADLQVILPDEALFILVDPSRIQQILINLLNNSLQAKRNGKAVKIVVTLKKQETERIEIELADNGYGIPLEEQPLIFERYYRGELKRHKTRGLGLGLTFSQMLARAQEGDLILKESSEAGSAFVLSLKMNEK